MPGAAISALSLRILTTTLGTGDIIMSIFQMGRRRRGEFPLRHSGLRTPTCPGQDSCLSSILPSQQSVTSVTDHLMCWGQSPGDSQPGNGECQSYSYKDTGFYQLPKWALSLWSKGLWVWDPAHRTQHSCTRSLNHGKQGLFQVSKFGNMLFSNRKLRWLALNFTIYLRTVYQRVTLI